MKKINYKKEIKKALLNEMPYFRDSGIFLFTPGIILFIQSEFEERFGEWITKAEIYEVLKAYLSKRKPDYGGILVPVKKPRNVIKLAKEYVDMVWEREKRLDKVSRLTGVDKDNIKQVSDDEFIISLYADEIDKSIQGFEERAEEYVKNLNLPKEIEILEIIPATLLPPMVEEDFEEDERLKECYVKKTEEELERDKEESKRLERAGIFSLELDSPYKMIKYAGINLRVRVKSLKKIK